MNADTRLLIEAIHCAPHKLVLAAAGGGTTAAGLLLAVPGGSRTVLEITVPYSTQSLSEYLGAVPEQSCSAMASQIMAAQAFERARRLAPRESVLGLGCTASLATDRPKRGDHRFFITTHTNERIRTYSLILEKGTRERESEEALVDTVLLNSLAEAFGISERLNPHLLPGEILHVDTTKPDLLYPFLVDKTSAICIETDGRVRTDFRLPAALLPGAFNPAHEGHWRLADVAARQLHTPVAFELSVDNVDKLPLTAAETCWRIEQFCWRAPVWLTRAPTFAEKASLFPGVVFVVGVDTAERIISPRYYRTGEAGLSDAMSRIRIQGCRFLVAGRHDQEGRFISLAELHIPAEYNDLFTGMSQSAFCVSISSTALRCERTSSKTVPSTDETDQP
jgi:hypothetical protein